MLSTLALAIVYLGGSAALAYLTTRVTMVREHRYGAMRLLELCRRYVIAHLRASEGGALAKKVYLGELTVIVAKVDSLLDAEYGRLAVQYPPISALVADLRRELITSESTDLLEPDRAVLARVADLYHAVRAHQPRRLRENDFDRDLERRLEGLA